MRKDTSYVYGSIATVMLPGFTVGTLLGWEFALTLNNDSNILSVPFGYLTAMLGIIISSYVMDRCGRRICIIWLLWLIYIAVIIRLISKHKCANIIMRLLGGLSVGVYFQVVPVYIAEMVYRRHRGIIMAACGTLMAIGVLASSTSYRMVFFLICDLIFGIIFFVLLFFYAPETPYHDVASDRIMAAKETLQLCLIGDNWSGAIREISLDVAAYPRDVSNCFSFALSFPELHADFAHRTVTSLGLLLFSQAMLISCHSGNVYHYDSVDNALYFLMDLSILLLAFLVNLFVIDVNGRKILLFSSAICVGIFYLLMFILNVSSSLDRRSIVMIIIRKLLMFSFYMGFDFIPILYLAELWPYAIRSPAIAFCLCLYFAAKSVHPVIFFYANIYLHSSIVPFGYVLIAAAAAVYVWYIPPETSQLSICAVQIKMDHDVTVLEKKMAL